MSSFCPDGYVTTPEAIYEAALSWHAERLAALEGSAAAVSSTGNRGVEALSWAISTQHRISQEVQQLYAEIVPKIVNRLRNLLYEGKLTAYYFGGLFSTGRNAVPSEYWATVEADGVLEAGSYFPFGRPSHSFEQRLSYPLFLLKAELNEVLSEQQPTTPLPRARIPELVAALRELDHLPNRTTQFRTVRDLPQFQGYRITDRVMREAAQQATRPLGRRQNQLSD